MAFEVGAAGAGTVYFPQFASLGIQANITVSAGVPVYQQYQMGGQAMSALALSQRLEQEYFAIAGAGGMGGMGGGYGAAAYAGAGAYGAGAFAVAGAGGVAAAYAPNQANYGSYGSPGSSSQPLKDDPYGVSQSGQGSSNMSNNPYEMLAMRDLLSKNPSMSFDDAAKKLQSDYGINAQVGDVKTTDDGKDVTVKGLKFPDGSYFVDGNGNGQLDKGDYKFDDAVKNLKDKYNLTDDNLKSIVDNMKNNATAENNYQQQVKNYQQNYQQGFQQGFGQGFGQYGGVPGQGFGYPGGIPGEGFGYPGGIPGQGFGYPGGIPGQGFGYPGEGFGGIPGEGFGGYPGQGYGFPGQGIGQGYGGFPFQQALQQGGMQMPNWFMNYGPQGPPQIMANPQQNLGWMMMFAEAYMMAMQMLQGGMGGGGMMGGGI